MVSLQKQQLKQRPKQGLKQTPKQMSKQMSKPILKKISKQQSSQKNCFGTKEWSNNSGICNGCEQKEDCGKVKRKRENPMIGSRR